MRQVQTCRPFGIAPFVQNQKQVILFNGATIQSIVATLIVVEMEPGKLARLDPLRHNHFDIHVWCVMARIDKEHRFFAQLQRRHG